MSPGKGNRRAKQKSKVVVVQKSGGQTEECAEMGDGGVVCPLQVADTKTDAEVLELSSDMSLLRGLEESARRMKELINDSQTEKGELSRVAVDLIKYAAEVQVRAIKER